MRQQLRALRYQLAIDAIPEDNEDKLMEIKELFEYDYQKYRDQQFILNTPGIKITDNKFELVEDDPLFDEDDYFQFLSEIEYEKKNTTGTGGTRNSELQNQSSQQSQPLKNVTEYEKESSEQRSQSALSLELSQDRDKSNQQLRLVIQKDNNSTDKDQQSQENGSEIDSIFEQKDNTDKLTLQQAEGSLKVDNRTRSQASSQKLQSSDLITITSPTSNMIAQNYYPRLKTPELSQASAKSYITNKSNLSSASATQKKHSLSH